MNVEAVERELSSSVDLNEVGDTDTLVLPRSLLVMQEFDYTSTPFGLRSTCQPASVINAARLCGHDVRNFQGEIISDPAVPWDPRNGGISVMHAGEMAKIYQTYLPGVAVLRFDVMPLGKVLGALLNGSALTASTGHEHSIALYGLFRHTGETYPYSIVADPITGDISRRHWVNLLSENQIQIDLRPNVFVHTTFMVL